MSANLKKRLQNGERLIGTMINRIDTLDIIPMLKACGMDYVIVDNEHGTWNPEKSPIWRSCAIPPGSAR